MSFYMVVSAAMHLFVICHSSYLSSMYRDLLAFALYFNFNLLNMTVIEDTEDFFKKNSHVL